MYLPSRMQGRGCLLRTFARLRVCSKTHDFETCNLFASCSGVKMSAGSNQSTCFGCAVASVSAFATAAPLCL